MKSTVYISSQDQVSIGYNELSVKVLPKRDFNDES